MPDYLLLRRVRFCVPLMLCVFVFLGGASPPTAAWSTVSDQLLATCRNVVCGDFDGDGKEEMFLTRSNPRMGVDMEIGRWNGNGLSIIAREGDIPIPDDYAAGDFDNDGRIEAVVCTLKGLLVVNKVDSTIETRIVKPQAPKRFETFETVAIGDIDNNSGNEIVLTDPIPEESEAGDVEIRSYRIRLFRYDGVKLSEIGASGPHECVTGMTIIDVDGDGNNELAVSETDCSSTEEAAWVSFYRLVSGRLEKDAALSVKHPTARGASSFQMLAKRKTRSGEELYVADRNGVRRYDAKTKSLSDPILSLPDGERVRAIYSCDYDGSGEQSLFVNVYSPTPTPSADAALTAGTQAAGPAAETGKPRYAYRTLVFK